MVRPVISLKRLLLNARTTGESRQYPVVRYRAWRTIPSPRRYAFDCVGKTRAHLSQQRRIAGKLLRRDDHSADDGLDAVAPDLFLRELHPFIILDAVADILEPDAGQKPLFAGIDEHSVAGHLRPGVGPPVREERLRLVQFRARSLPPVDVPVQIAVGAHEFRQPP